jgi:tetratricopeptide (TPR) repeat protein
MAKRLIPVTTSAKQGTASRAVKLRRWAVVLSILALSAIGGILAWRWIQDGERQQALRLAERGDFTNAEPLLKRVAERHAKDAPVARALALGYLSSDRLVEAETYFARWCAVRPADPEPYEMRIKLWLRRSRITNVVDDARRVVELQPDNRKLRQQLPRWLLILGRFQEAESECQRFLHSWPDDPWVLLVQALLHQRQGRSAAAIPIADRLVREYPDFAEACVLRGTLYVEANQSDEAIPLLRRATAIQGPHRREALYELGLALEKTGQSREAERAMAEARLLLDQERFRGMADGSEGERRDYTIIQVRLAEGMLEAGQTEDALRLLRKILERQPDCAAAHRSLAAHYEKEGQPERAAEHRRRAGPTP